MVTTEDNVSKKQKRDWKNLIQTWLKSNFPISAYCRANNLSQATFHYWKDKLVPKKKGKFNQRGKVSGVERCLERCQVLKFEKDEPLAMIISNLLSEINSGYSF